MENGQQMQIIKQTLFPAFGIGNVTPLPDGGAQVDIVLPNGEVMCFPMNREAALELGKKLTAPRVATETSIPVAG